MTVATPIRSFYVTGGTLLPDSPSYVERKADRELFEHVLAGDYCYVLTSRQMGKSSLMARTARKLRSEGVLAATVDLTAITDTTEASAAQWYYGIAETILESLELENDVAAWWDEKGRLPSVQRWVRFLRELVLAKRGGRRLVIFVDEIDSTIGLPFTGDFFAAIRACYNLRATDMVFQDLCFVLLGTASPSDLIADRSRTPFNVGTRIHLTDFIFEEAKHLASGLSENPQDGERALRHILWWTGGHPYLTQTLCDLSVRESSNGMAENEIDRVVDKHFLAAGADRNDYNLRFVRDRLIASPEVGHQILKVYRQILSDEMVADDPLSQIYSELKLSGLVRSLADNRLIVRNRIYQRVFNEQWIAATEAKNVSRHGEERARRLRRPAASAAKRSGELAATLVEYLAPALPYLSGVDERMAEEAVAKLGSDTWAKAKELWGKLRPKLAERPLVEEVVRDLAEEPEDADMQTVLRVQIRKLLSGDAELSESLSTAITGSSTHVVAGGQVAVGRDVQGNVTVVNASASAIDADRLFRLTGEPALDEGLEAATSVYLRHLLDLYRYIDFRGIISDRVPLKLPLLELYVPLRARAEVPAGETWIRRTYVAGRAPAEEKAWAMDHRPSEPQPVLELLRSNDCLIVLGDPGSGKTTFLKVLALALATGQGEALGLGQRLPALVPLSAYAIDLERKDVSLDRFIDQYYRDRGVDQPIGKLLDRALRLGRTVFLLDGLDEVPDLGRRHLVVDRFKDFYAVHRAAGNKFVLTSRIVDYRKVRFQAEGLAECTLVDFGDEEIESYMSKWTAASDKAVASTADPVAGEAERERQELLAAVRHPGVRELAATPLLLSILVLLKRQGLSLPQRRVEFYYVYVNTLLRHWNLARGLDRRGADEFDMTTTLHILTLLALWMHQTSPGQGLVKERALIHELERILHERGNEEPERAACDFLDHVRGHAGLLVDHGARQYGFIHLALQEYLAAVALAQQAQQGISPLVDELAARVSDDTWHEVSRLTIGYIGIVQQREEDAGAALEELMLRSSGSPGEAVVLAGHAVADVWPGGVTAGCRQRVVKALLDTLRDDERVEPSRRASAGRVLAEVGDPRPEIMTVDAMEFCLVPPGPFVMGSGDDDTEAPESEKPQHENEVQHEFWVARYPVIVAQFRTYLEDCGEDSGHPAITDDPPNWPARRVSWYEALEFCEWLTSRWRQAEWLDAGWIARLPTEREWEKSARGGRHVPSSPVLTRAAHLKNGTRPGLEPNRGPQRRYPWGEDSDVNKANYDESGLGAPSPLGCFPGGASPYGCEELSGNLWEWTSSLWGEAQEKPFRYPYDPGDGRENPESKHLRVLRGGSFFNQQRWTRCAARLKNRSELRIADAGFRVVLVRLSRL